jgi:hypothetical protein
MLLPPETKGAKVRTIGDEACNSNRLAAMLIEEILGDLEFISINEAAEERIVAGGQAHVMTDVVIDGIADYSGG